MIVHCIRSIYANCTTNKNVFIYIKFINQNKRKNQTRKCSFRKISIEYVYVLVQNQEEKITFYHFKDCYDSFYIMINFIGIGEWVFDWFIKNK